MSFKCGISSNICLNFHSSIFVTTILFALKGIPHVKYEKKLVDNVCFFLFFKTLGQFGPNFAPRPHPLWFFFAGFQWNMLRDSINVNNFN